MASFPLMDAIGGFFDVLVRQVQVYPVDTFNRCSGSFEYHILYNIPGWVVHDHDVILRAIISRCASLCRIVEACNLPVP